MKVEEHIFIISWGRIGKLAIPIGIGLLLMTAWLLGAHAILPVRAATSTLYVDGASGSNGMNNCQVSSIPCKTIVYALNQVGSDDVIQVAEGTYTNTFNIAITVTLRGGYEAADWSRDINAHPTIIDANGAAVPVFHITPDSNFTIEGFTVEGSENSAGTGGGFLINNATVVISATVVQDNEAENGGGVWVQGDNADVMIENSSLLNNRAEASGGGLHNNGWGQVTLLNSVVQGNTSQSAGGGIWANQVTISSSQILSNTSAADGGGISGSYADIFASQISNNAAIAGDHTYGGGLDLSNGSLHLEDSEVTNNSAVSTGTLGISGGSAMVVNQADTTILNTVVSDNKNGGNTIAVFSGTLTITNAMIVNNDGDAIASDDRPVTATLTNVTIAGNGSQGISMNEDPNTDVSVSNSILWNNPAIDNNCGTRCSIKYSIIGTGDTSGEGNLSVDPSFVDPANGDYHLLAWSQAIDNGTAVGAPAVDFEGDARPQNDGYDMGADEFVGTPLKSSGYRYVATSGSDSSNPCVEPDNPCQTVAHALDMAESDETVLIAAGTYTENLELAKTLTIRGGYTISGTAWLTDTGETVIDGNSSGRVFFIHDNNSTLEYLTITGGNAPDDKCWGGGAWITNGNFTIRNTVFRNNRCSGLEVNVDLGPVEASIEDSLFMENIKLDHGGAINTWGGTTTLKNVLVVSNTKNSLVASNDSQVNIINSTFTDNAPDGPAITIIGSGMVTLTNSIVWGNPGGNMACDDGTCNITYSDIEGGWTGQGNIDEDPIFMDTTADDYSLAMGSPCIDSGTDNGAPDHDLAGTERPLDGDGDGEKTTDMGAYEFRLYQIYLPYTQKGNGS